MTAAWADRSREGATPRPEKAKAVAGALLLLGAILLWFLPLGGALFMVTGGLGLAIASESPGPHQPATELTHETPRSLS